MICLRNLPLKMDVVTVVYGSMACIAMDFPLGTAQRSYRKIPSPNVVYSIRLNLFVLLNISSYPVDRSSIWDYFQSAKIGVFHLVYPIHL